MFDKFFDWYKNRHDYARNWLGKHDGQVVGCFCSYVPEELLVAADILPARVLGSHEPQDVTEPHIFGMFCPFCRDVLAQGLKGRYDYLDGITLSQSCLHLRQAFTSWRMHIPAPFLRRDGGPLLCQRRCLRRAGYTVIEAANGANYSDEVNIAHNIVSAGDLPEIIGQFAHSIDD